MKRFTSLFLALVMAVSMLAGCGGSDEKKETEAPKETAEAEKKEEQQDTKAETEAPKERQRQTTVTPSPSA